jgi:hypothetical protein
MNGIVLVGSIHAPALCGHSVDLGPFCVTHTVFGGAGFLGAWFDVEWVSRTLDPLPGGVSEGGTTESFENPASRSSGERHSRAG